MRKLIFILLIISLLMLAGCKEAPEEPGKPPSPPGMNQEPEMDLFQIDENQKPKPLYTTIINL